MFLHQNYRTTLKKKDFGPYRYYVLFALWFTGACLYAQTSATAPVAATPQTETPSLPLAQQPGVLAPGKTDQGEDRYAYGVLPNYRTAEMSAIGHPLTAQRKMLIAAKDSFAPTLVGIGLAYAGLSQLDDSHPEFGQGMEGYAKRFATSYADQAIGNFMTEGIFPSLLRQDPRYFRMSHGTVGQRVWYAINRIVVTKTDSGKSVVNLSELMGNAAAAGIGLSYYPDSRSMPDYLQNWGTQLATDALSQISKEFWPDIKRWLHKKRGDDRPMSEVPPSRLQ